jgi:prepilin-type N-terminal cleavage/methylation domain-containing protein
VSRLTERKRPRADSGFTLIEVIVALGLVGLIVAALVPALISGIRANDVARTTSQSKNFLQAELERLRNMPFHISAAAGDYRDVFDRYYRNLQPAGTPSCGSSGHRTTPTTAWTGYVSASATRCWWEPSGAFYRYVRTGGSANPELAGFVVVSDTQFVTDATPPVVSTPGTEYNSQTVGKDRPPTFQARITMAAYQVGRGSREPVVTSTQLSSRDTLVQRTSSSVDVTSVDLGTANDADYPVTLSAGLVKLATSLTNASTAQGVVTGASTGAATGQQATGAALTVAAPPDGAFGQASALAGALDGDGCRLACWGQTQYAAGSLATANGLPNVGAPTTPLQAVVKTGDPFGLSLGAGAGAGYRSDLGLLAATGAGGLLTLTSTETANTVDPGVSSTCAGSGSGGPVRVAGSGWLRTTAASDASNPSLVEACGVARSAFLAVLPTTFAPYGVVRVSLPDASVRCAVSGAGHTGSVSASYTGVVERWTPSGYQQIAQVTQASATDPLESVPLTTPLGSHGVLGDYIQSWSMLPSTGIRKTTGTGVAVADVPGVVTITTQPMRDDGTGGNDPLSTASVSLGNLSCSARDAR